MYDGDGSYLVAWFCTPDSTTAIKHTEMKRRGTLSGRDEGPDTRGF